MNLDYRVQMMCCRAVCPQPVYFVTQCHLNKINKKENKKEKIKLKLNLNIKKEIIHFNEVKLIYPFFLQ